MKLQAIQSEVSFSSDDLHVEVQATSDNITRNNVDFDQESSDNVDAVDSNHDAATMTIEMYLVKAKTATTERVFGEHPVFAIPHAMSYTTEVFPKLEVELKLINQLAYSGRHRAQVWACGPGVGREFKGILSIFHPRLVLSEKPRMGSARWSPTPRLDVPNRDRIQTFLNISSALY
ncbi:hypothetical protein RRG08_037598 [Elysia crispata]|uniref:Uncharacterized protein n=1 Tax=Elysia crispata TaxID=231223 RepID=A0AAE0YGI8_9GAST|nr:hypothetical protein RRG08_037598 [Elysia crispata]